MVPRGVGASFGTARASQRNDIRAGGNGALRPARLHLALGRRPQSLRFEKANVLGFSMDFAEDVTKSNWGVEFTWVEDSSTSATTTSPTA